MARLVVGSLPLIAVAMAAAGLSACELVMDDLPQARSPDAGLDASPDIMDSLPEADAAEEPLEETGPGDAAVEEPPVCDHDLDTHEAVSCGGDDCDDEDANVFSGQTVYFEVESLHNAFDYDCNNQFDPDPAWNVLASCAGLSLLLCDDTHQGFVQKIPGCGQAGQWGKCFKNGAFCDTQVLYDAKKLPCR